MMKMEDELKTSWLRSGRQRTPYQKPMRTKLQRMRAMQPVGGIDMKRVKRAFMESNKIVAELRRRQPTCAICLGDIEVRCFLNECLHSYCLECLADWSKEKASCPICNESFSAGFFYVKSVRSYHRMWSSYYPNSVFGLRKGPMTYRWLAYQEFVPVFDMDWRYPKKVRLEFQRYPQVPQIPGFGAQPSDPDAEWIPSSNRPSFNVPPSVPIPNDPPPDVDFLPGPTYHRPRPGVGVGHNPLYPPEGGFVPIPSPRPPRPGLRPPSSPPSLPPDVETVPSYGPSRPIPVSSDAIPPLFKVIPVGSGARSNPAVAPAEFPKRDVCFCYRNGTSGSAANMRFVGNGISTEVQNLERAATEFSRWQLFDSGNRTVGDCLCHGYETSGQTTEVSLDVAETETRFQVYVLESSVQQNWVGDGEEKGEDVGACSDSNTATESNCVK